MATIDKTADGVPFEDRFVDAVDGTFLVLTVYLGDELGFYDALADARADSGDDDHGTLTPDVLAARTGTDGRYVREWLEQQTVAGVVDCANPDASPDERRYALPAAHLEPLTDEDSLSFLPPFAQLLVGLTKPIDEILAAYRTGEGVPYADYGDVFREGQGRVNRAAFLASLGEEWFPSVREIDALLSRAEPAPRVADVGCGYGWSAIGLAQSYPGISVDGYDLDEPSVRAARANAREAGVEDRVTFHVRDVTDPDLAGEYDLVTAFECVHDLSDPVGGLRGMRRLLADGGTAVVVDERVGHSFAPGSDAADATFEWMMYGWSVLHCLPVGRATEPSAATGTVMRPDTLEAYATEAGFDAVETLPIEDDFFRFYRLTV